MSRKSRKHAGPGARQVYPEERFLYHGAVYARLSVQDNNSQGNSINHQIMIVNQYVKGISDLEMVRTFVDSGQTGTNFERPGFLQMMEAIKKGTINCIVVKDLSRFGRNYLETGNYLENIFPCLGVRFISVNDQFDSLDCKNSDAWAVPLKSILHDAYAKDISRKTSTAIDMKKKSGKFMGKIPPYGYVREEQDAYKLCIHPERAKVVRQIFKWRLEGIGPSGIARRLNGRNIPSQLALRYMEGKSDGKKDALWHGSVVSEILKNPCYTGCMVERKGRNLLCEGKVQTMIPENEWRLIENTHEPIIDKQTFETVKWLRLKT